MANNQPPRLDAARVKARNLLLVNLLVLPGLGSILGQQKIGWLQASLALAGFALTAWWFTSFVIAWIGRREFPMNGGPQFLWGLLGLGLFLIAWVWALATGLSIVRQARRE